MGNKQQNKKNTQRGFTLLEMLVAVGMISILLSIGGISLKYYQKSLKLSELDTVARQLFVVAQNYIMKTKASGEWEKLVEKYKDDVDTYLGPSMTQRPSDYPSEEVWPERENTDTYDYRYVVYNGQEEILNDTILSHILPYGAIDEHVRKNGQYIIEYDYQSGNVYGVFYTDSSQTLDYERDIIGASGLNANKGRENSQEGREVRKNYKNNNGHMIIGYYGGAVVNPIETVALEALEMQVNNGERLEITIKDKNYGKVIDGVKVQTKIAITVTGEESLVSDISILEIDSMRKRVDNEWWVGEVDKGVAIYTLILDDITKEGGHFADLFPTLIPGENIVVQAEAFSEEVLCTPVRAQVYTNSLFESNYAYQVNGELAAKVIIKNIRHLQNLNSKISHLPTGNLAYEVEQKQGRIVRKAEQIESLDWNNFLGQDHFYSIDNIALVAYEGNGYTLSNFDFQGNEEGNTGLFAQVGNEEMSQNLVVKNLVLEGFVSESQKEYGNAGTLVGEVTEKGTFKGENIFVMNPTVRATYKGNSGGLIGKMSNGHLRQVGVYLEDATKYELGSYHANDPIQPSEYRVASTRGVAGGLVGEMENTSIAEAFAAIPVIDSSGGVAGGLVGKIIGDLEQTTTITNSHVGGYTIDGKYSTYYGVTALGSGGRAGGLIGEDSAKVTHVNNNYSTASVYGDIVGGLVGKLDGGKNTYKNSYATGVVTGSTTNSKRGGWIGQINNIGSTTIKYNYYLKQSNPDLQPSLSGVEALEYDALIEVTHTTGNKPNEKYYCYDQALQGMAYPFGTVTTIGGTRVHYGDWPLKEEQITVAGDVGLVYYEIIEDKLYYHGYFGEYSSEESQPNYKEVMTDGVGLVNGLVASPNKYVSEDGYIILVPEGTDVDKIAVALGDKKAQSGTRWKLTKIVEDFHGQHLVPIEGYDAYYFVYNFSGEVNKYAPFYITIGENKGTNSWDPPVFGDYVSFYFSPYFGDTVSTKRMSEEKLYIRSARHLLSIAQLEDSHTNKENIEFIQALDISYEDMSFTQNGKAHSYDYKTIGMISADYTVDKYNSNNEIGTYVIKGLSLPLFNDVQKSSTIKGVTLVNSRVKEGASLVKRQNNGVIESCSVRAENAVNTGYQSVVVEGVSSTGFVKDNYGTIRNSYFVGTVTGDVVSGFVETNNGTIENSYANVILEGKTSATGFVRNHNKGTIRNSFVVGSVQSTDANSVAYGFIQDANNEVIVENNYAALFQLSGNKIYRFGRGRGNQYLNNVWLDNTYTKGEVQIGDTNDTKERGTAISYEDMLKRGTYPTTHPYKSSYEHIEQNSLVYPFELISTEDAYMPMAFWGDWPAQDIGE